MIFIWRLENNKNEQFDTRFKNWYFSRAKVFIEGIGEFAPFGSKSINGNVKPVIYSGEADENDSIDSTKGIKILKEQFSKEIKENKIDAAYSVWCSSQYKNSDGISEKRDALCLEITTDGYNWADEYFPYMIIDGSCVWR